MKKMAVVIAGVAVSFFAMTFVSEAVAVALPGYVSSGSLDTNLTTKGEAITKIAISVAVMVGIICIIIGAIKVMSGDADGGKKWIVGSVVGLIIIAVVGGIAALALK